MISKRNTNLSDEQIFSALKANPNTVRYTEIVTVNKMYQVGTLVLLGIIGKDEGYRDIVDCYDGVRYRWNPKGTHRCGIRIPGWIVLRYIYDTTIGNATRAA